MCIRDSSTIGLRMSSEKRRVLPRRTVTVKEDGMDIRVKVVDLPEGGLSVKAEHEDLKLVTGGSEKRRLVKASAEQKARAGNDK